MSTMMVTAADIMVINCCG